MGVAGEAFAVFDARGRVNRERARATVGPKGAR